ncbi:coenzyme Q-binding protein COQ10 homolog, mitochondrial [Notolabrus celidotus]|uniref:coenzyme Q-binding protein COQ10 homolog, mitochondrial n=1 Tax=Notolabrus celidotus TaxID=1203425 RepID=UPI00148FDCA7|nr:coenzyme Q-binding protein COQ10 homolog, mitochondrial [Notolabrus celidotus]
MTNKRTHLLLKALLDVSEAHSVKVLRGNSKRDIRHLGSCGALVARRASLPICPTIPTTITPTRSFINLVAPIITRRMEYNESRTIGYSLEQMYNVVANVDQYQHFVPWCKKSRVIKGPNGTKQAELEIGFPPISERYTSDVTCIPNHQVRAVCTDGSLFNHLETIWRFAPGPKDRPDSCKVDFYVTFEFRSLLHTQLVSVFFDEVVKQMVSAFESRAATLNRSQQGAPLRRRST